MQVHTYLHRTKKGRRAPRFQHCPKIKPGANLTTSKFTNAYNDSDAIGQSVFKVEENVSVLKRTMEQ